MRAAAPEKGENHAQSTKDKMFKAREKTVVYVSIETERHYAAVYATGRNIRALFLRIFVLPGASFCQRQLPSICTLHQLRFYLERGRGG